jgi:hypothetical protein
VNDLNTTRQNLAAAGIQTAALAFGGGGPGVYTESWDGTSWTDVNDLNTGRDRLAGAGTQTSALAFGASALTESWNGTSWITTSNLNTGRETLAGAGADNTSALAFGGTTSPPGATEEWNVPGTVVQTITTS